MAKRNKEPSAAEVGEAIRDKVQWASDFTDSAMMAPGDKPRGLAPLQVLSHLHITDEGAAWRPANPLSHSESADAELTFLLSPDASANLKLQALILRTLAGLRDDLQTLQTQFQSKS